MISRKALRTVRPRWPSANAMAMMLEQMVSWWSTLMRPPPSVRSYLSGDSLGRVAAGLEEQVIPSPAGKSKWNREALNKLLSNEKYTARYIQVYGYHIES